MLLTAKKIKEEERFGSKDGQCDILEISDFEETETYKNIHKNIQKL